MARASVPDYPPAPAGAPAARPPRAGDRVHRLVERPAGFLDDLVDLLPGDDEGGREDHALRDRAHHEAVREAAVAAEGADVALGLEALPGRRILGELDGREHPDAANLSDEGVVRQLAYPGLEVRDGVLPATLDNPFFPEDPDVLDRDRARDGMPGVGEAVEELATLPEEGFRDPVVHHDPTNRDVAGGEPLRDRHQIGVEPVVLGAEPGPRSPEAADHLVGDEQHAVLPADAGDFRPVGVRRHDDPARALDRLRDERGHPLRPEREDPVLEGPCRHEPEFFRGSVAAQLVPVGLHHVLDPRNGEPALAVHGLHAPEARRAHRAPVVGVVAREDDVSLRLADHVEVAAHHPDHGVVRLRARVGEEDVVEPRGGHLGEDPAELRGGGMGGVEEGVVVRQLRHLTRCGVRELAAAVADVHAPQPRHRVDEAAPVRVPEVDALGADDHARPALRVKGRVVGEGVEVMAGVDRPQIVGGRCGRGLAHRHGVLPSLVVAGRAGSVLGLIRCGAGTRAPTS